MGFRLILIGAVLALIAAGLAVMSDPERMNGLRAALGMPPIEQFDVARLEPEEIEAEIARLEAVALPVQAEQSAEEDAAPVTVGQAARTARECLEAAQVFMRPPKERAEAGLHRYLVVLLATAAAPDTPLLAPRFRALGDLARQQPAALAAALEKDGAGPDATALLEGFQASYGDVDNPLYRGLELYGQTFEGLDFQKLADALARHARGVARCTIAQLWPEPAPEQAAAAPETGSGDGVTPGEPVAWRCEGLNAPVGTTVLDTDPPSLLVEHDGRTEIGLQVPAASGALYQGPFGSFWLKGGEARLATADGRETACSLVAEAQ